MPGYEWPNCPFLLEPNVNTEPLFASTAQCDSPAEIYFIFCIGTLLGE
jgi:hypothetical protein